MVALPAVSPHRPTEQQWKQEIAMVNILVFIVLGFILVYSPSSSSNFNLILYTINFEEKVNIILTRYLAMAKPIQIYVGLY